MNKKLFALFVLALAGGLYFFFFHEASTRESDPATLTLYGNVDIRDVSLGFRVSGRIESMLFEEGDMVQAGTVLARLDAQPYTEELALSRALLEETEATVRSTEKVFVRREKLLSTRAVSQADYDDALATRDEALARRETARARLAQAQTQLEDAVLKAPSDGIILTRVREAGSIVAAGTSVYVLALHNPVWVRTYIDEPRLGSVHPGQKAIVTTSAGQHYEGQVGYISPQAEFTPKNVETAQLRSDLVYRLRVVVDKPDNSLRQGMPVTVTLER